MKVKWSVSLGSQRNATSTFQVVLTKSMVKQSGTIGCVLMELNLVYDVACCLFAFILYAPTARISPSNINAPSQQRNTLLMMKTVL